MTDGRAAGNLRFEILGDVRVLRSGTPVDLGPAKQRAVLAVLLLQAGRPVPVHQIVDAVWGDEPPENGANVVQKYVAGLRRVLDPDRAPRTPGELLALTGGGYVLRIADGSFDAQEFQTATTQAVAERAAGRLTEAAETLRRGLALWRGDALSGMTGPVFEAARLRLAEAHATAWEKWADVELARGQSTGLIPDLARLVEEFPLREGLRAQLMIAFHQGGRQAEALATFRDAREYYLDQFGVEPGERMQDAHRRILRGEPFYTEPVDPWAGEATPTPTPTPMPAPAPVFEAPTPTPPPYYPPIPQQPIPAGVWVAPPRRKVPILEVVFAALIPLITISVFAWAYFIYAALRHRNKRLYYVSLAYFLLFVLACVCMGIDPTPVESGDFSTAESIGTLLFVATAFGASVHGSVVATHSADSSREWILREQARQFAALDPIRAANLGVGRPDIPRAFEDGGLIDLNRVPGPELARIARLTMEDAHRIVADRLQRGPFRRPDELVERGLLSPKTMRRLSPVLIAIPLSAEPAPWLLPPV